MEQLIDLANGDASKYKDVINIFLKLQGDGGIKDLSAQFDKIFKNETKFTITELEKIEKSRDEKLDLEKHCESNLALFKNNFQVIVQLLIENAFKNATTNIPELCEKRLNTNTKENEDHTTLQSSTARITPSRGLEETPKSKSKKSSLSNIEKAKSTGKKKKTKTGSKKSIAEDSSPASSSRISGVLQKIINSGSGSIGINSSRSSKTGGLLQDSQRHQNSTLSNVSKKSSLYHHSPSHSNLSKSYVESEFNYIKGSATFENSKRSFLEIKESTPGPTDYNVDKSSPASSKMKRSFSPTIGNAKKQSYIQQLTNTPSPGPGGLYPSHHFLSK